MRRLAAAMLAMPVFVTIYLATLIAVPGARKYLAVVGAALLVAVIGVGMVLPPSASSIPPSTPRPITNDQLTPVQTDAHDTAAASASPADAAIVAGPLVADAPADRPAPVSAAVVDTSASGTSSAAVPAVSVRAPTKATVAGSQTSGNRLRLTSGIVLRFDRPVALTQVRAAFAIKPAVKGTIRAQGNRLFTFTPAAALAANTAYTISFKKPIKDSEGLPVAVPGVVRLLTAPAPAIVRFRPTKGTGQVDPSQIVSVRFTRPMNHATTAKAFSVVVAGRRVPGSISWAENDTVLIFKPSRLLAKGSGVGVRVLQTATSADGVMLKQGGSATFTVTAPPKPAPTIKVTPKSTAKPAPRPVSRPVSKPVSKPKPPVKPGSGGGSVGGGAWGAAETYYLKLMNCTRTGGWVTGSGACSSPGGRNVAPLWIDSGISARVSRPYAKYLASTGICSHFADGNPGTRLRRAGYTSYRWAENISCPKSMNVMHLMVYTQQYFQNEKSYMGGHYVNLMNPLYDRVGIGVWVANGRAELVIDFYRP